jgi:hypothetical protein
MIDEKQADQFYERCIQLTGKPPLVATYEPPRPAAAGNRAADLSTAEVVTEAQVRDYATNKHWVTILPRSRDRGRRRRAGATALRP